MSGDAVAVSEWYETARLGFEAKRIRVSVTSDKSLKRRLAGRLFDAFHRLDHRAHLRGKLIDESVQLGFSTLAEQFHAAIGQVSHIAANFELASHPASRGAKAYALHVTSEKVSPSHRSKPKKTRKDHASLLPDHNPITLVYPPMFEADKRSATLSGQ